MSSLLMICCSLGRPHRIKEMLESYEATKSLDSTDILICLNSSDTRLSEYDYLKPKYNIITRNPNYYTPVANEITSTSSYDYYGLVDDDYIFRTPSWDKIMVNTLASKGKGWGISYVNDLWHDSSVVFRHPSVPIMSAKQIKTVGYMILPTLNHFKIDTYMRDLVEPLGLLFYHPEVIVEHMHFHQKKAPDDASYRWSYCPEEWQHGEKEYRIWKNLQADKDRAKIINAIETEKMLLGEV